MQAESHVAWVENAATNGRRHVDARELWSYRDLALFLALRDLKVRYRQALFGVLWAVIQPLAGVIRWTRMRISGSRLSVLWFASFSSGSSPILTEIVCSFFS